MPTMRDIHLLLNDEQLDLIKEALFTYKISLKSQIKAPKHIDDFDKMRELKDKVYEIQEVILPMLGDED